jgi:peroxiredoxin family protein
MARRRSFVVNTASYERVSFSLSVAASLASLGDDVSMLFGFGGVLRLRRGWEDRVGPETGEWVRGDAERWLSGGNRAARITDLLRLARELGVKIYACPTAMAFHGISREDLTDAVDGVMGMTEFLSREDADVIYV